MCFFQISLCFSGVRCHGGLQLFIFNFVNEKPPKFDDKDLRLVVQDHLNVLQDGLRRRSGQHFCANEIGKRGLRLSDVFGDFLRDPRPDAFLHQSVVHQVPLDLVFEERVLGGGDLVDQTLDVSTFVFAAFL